MARTYKALALLLSYPEETWRAHAPAAVEAVRDEGLAPASGALVRLAQELATKDLLEMQARYVELFDRSRTLSLNLYEHVHGESRDRGQAMVELKRLYESRGVQLQARELPDHLPVFLEFLSLLPAREAGELLGEAAHVLGALRDRLRKRRSPYAAVFDALAKLAAKPADAAALSALMAATEDDPDDLEALDRVWAETPVEFGPGAADAGASCPRAEAIAARIGGQTR